MDVDIHASILEILIHLFNSSHKWGIVIEIATDMWMIFETSDRTEIQKMLLIPTQCSIGAFANSSLVLMLVVQIATDNHLVCSVSSCFWVSQRTFETLLFMLSCSTKNR